jgi:beta-galactosidase
VRLNRARTSDGRRLWFLSNWSWSTHVLEALPVGGTDLFNGQVLPSNGGLELGPWDMKILVESDGDARP